MKKMMINGLMWAIEKLSTSCSMAVADKHGIRAMAKGPFTKVIKLSILQIVRAAICVDNTRTALLTAAAELKDIAQEFEEKEGDGGNED